jgi:hypothetical protein
MLHWIDSEDRIGLPAWLRYVECSHWGLFCTHELPRWIIPHSWESGIAQVRAVA